MKLNKKSPLLAVGLLGVAALAGCSGSTCGDDCISIWVSETDGVAELTKTQVQRYLDENNLNYKIEVTGITEADSASNMLKDVSAGADIYCFAQDQFARLALGNALSAVPDAYADDVKTKNAPASVAGATAGTTLKAYPLTADNGYFMFYDASVIGDTDVTKLEELIAKCESSGKKFAMENESSAWYIASWFFAHAADSTKTSGWSDDPLCVSEWTSDATGKFTSVTDTWYEEKSDSKNGVIACKGMMKLLKSSQYISSSSADVFSASDPAAVLVSGTWAYNDVKRVLGDNLRAAPLPTFEVDGTRYHMGSYSGSKLMGVKPSSDAEKTAVLHAVANYLSGERCQLERYQNFGWGPSNLVDQDNEAVKNDACLKALNEQNQFAQIQGQIDGGWWDVAKVIGTDIKAIDTSMSITEQETAIKASLKKYHDALDWLVSMTTEEREAFTVIGAIKDTNFGSDVEFARGTAWSDWSIDIKMTSSADGLTWTSPALNLTAGDEFQVRQGQKWTVQFGAVDATTGLSTKNNFVITADNAGKKKIQVVVTKDKDGAVQTGVVSLVD